MELRISGLGFKGAGWSADWVTRIENQVATAILTDFNFIGKKGVSGSVGFWIRAWGRVV